MKRLLLLTALSLTGSVQPSAQMVGSCAPLADRKPLAITELRGVVVDENLALMPKVEVRLQLRHDRDFRDIEVAETNSSGEFGFETHSPGQYRLAFSGPKGFCAAAIRIRYTRSGLKGMRLTLPTAATDTCPQYCESRLKIEEMTGWERRE